MHIEFLTFNNVTMTNSTDSQNYRDNLANRLKKERSKKRIPFIQKSGKELAKNLLEQEKQNPEYQEVNIQKFIDLLNAPKGKLTKKLNKNIAISIIDAGKGEYVAKNVDKFSSKDHKEIAGYLIDHNLGTEVIENLYKFQDFNHSELSQKLTHNLYEKDLTKEDFKQLFEKFKGTDPTKVVLWIVEDSPEIVVANWDKVSGVDHKKVAEQIIKQGDAILLAKYLHKLPRYSHNNQPLVDYNTIANSILDSKEFNKDNIVPYLNKFKDLHKSVMNKFIEGNHMNTHYVLENLNAFDDDAKKWFINEFLSSPKLSFDFEKAVLNDEIVDKLRKLYLWNDFEKMLQKQGLTRLLIERKNKDIQKTRYNQDIRDAQHRGPEIKLTKGEISAVKKLIDSQKLIYQSGFASVFITEDGNLYINRKESFSGNVLEYIDKYAHEIYKDTGIRFCYHPIRHNPISEKGSGGFTVDQFILVPCSVDTSKQIN